MDYLEYCRGEHTADNIKLLHEQLDKLPDLLKQLDIEARAVSPYAVKGIAKNDEPDCDVAFDVSIEDISLSMLFTSKIYHGVPLEKEGELVDLLNELNRGLFCGAFFFSCEDQSVIYRSGLFAHGKLSEQNVLYFIADSIACTADFGSLVHDFLRGKISFEDCMALLDGAAEEEFSPAEFN